MQASFRLAHLVIPSVNRGVRVDINQGNSQLHSWPPTHVGSTLTFISRGNSLWRRILQASFRFRQDFQLPGCFESLHLSGSFEMKRTVCEFSFLNFLFLFFFFFWSIGIGNGKQKENYVETSRIGFMIYQDLEIHSLKVDA